ncbi:MAG: hemolysin family protein [Prolixibacteraceae bacterium]|jgi:CBS domain containing-hemolysin-like protein|nr:hemolysin family protein [Prolixibacteraceae bacterium]
MGMLFLYLTVALAISFLCSVLESILLSVTFSYIYLKEQQGSRSAVILKNIKTKIDRPLAAILTLNTVAHTVGAAGVGSQATKIFGEAYFGLVSAILTILILVLSEIIPKTIGARFWRELALPSARIVRVLIMITYPLVIFSELITRLFSNRKNKHSVSREEVAVMASLGHVEGVFEESESKTINNLIRLKDIKVKDIMTPRTVLVAASENLTMSDFFREESFRQFSRIPVYEENIDQITGYILKQDILYKLATGEKGSLLKDEKREIIACYENFTVPGIFEKLLLSKEHIALVINEYGGTEGLITMEDIIETILGLEITDEKDIQADMQQLARDLWAKRTKNVN